MEPNQSRRFIQWLMVAAIGWMAIGIAVYYSNIEDLWTFSEAFVFSFLDLVFLILIFWKLFFVKAETIGAKRARVVQIMLFIFFKLVCLGFLAIVLKRLRNASFPAIILGVGFIGIGPLVAGLITRKKSNFEVQS